MNSIGHGLPAIIPLSSHGIIAGHCKEFALLTGLRRHAQKQPTPRRQMWEARGLHHGTCAGNWFAGRQGVGARGMTEKLAGPRTCPAAAAAPATVEMADFFLSGRARGRRAPGARGTSAAGAIAALRKKRWVRGPVAGRALAGVRGVGAGWVRPCGVPGQRCNVGHIRPVPLSGAVWPKFTRPNHNNLYATRHCLIATPKNGMSTASRGVSRRSRGCGLAADSASADLRSSTRASR